MGVISKKLGKLFQLHRPGILAKLRRAPDAGTVPTDVKTVQELVEESGLHPLHAAYMSVQHLVSYFAEQLSQLDEMSAYYDIVVAAEDTYLPSGPPMSPLTRSYFNFWACHDLRFGQSQETMGTCILELADVVGVHPSMAKLIELVNVSRMGIYEHCGAANGFIQLRELITDSTYVCICPSGYNGQKGELWYVRLAPPCIDAIDYHVALTTPYILTQHSKADWTAYLKKSLLKTKKKDEAEALHEFMKYGESVNFWNEFIFEAYHHPSFNAIFLAGLPDVAGSRPHAPYSK